MKSTRKAFVHIGMPKTGSSAVQAAMAEARDQLAAIGLLYPGNETDHVLLVPAFHQDGADHFYFNFRGETPEQYIPRTERLLDEIKVSSAQQPSADILISSEYLHDLNKESLQRLDRFFSDYGLEMVAVCFVRHPVDAAQSQTQQNVKQGAGRLADLHARPMWHSARDTLQAPLEVLGKDRLIVLDYASARQVGTERFLLSAIGYEHAASLIKPAQINESLSMAAVYLCDAHNELSAIHPEITHKRGYLFSIGGSKYRLPKDAVDVVRREGSDELRWLSDNFGIELQESHCTKLANEDVLTLSAALDIVRHILGLHT